MENPTFKWHQSIFLLAFGIAVVAGLSWLQHGAWWDSTPSPKTLREAGLVGVKIWSPQQMALAAKVSAREMKDIDALLHDLSRKGDAVGAVALFDRTIQITRAWNEQAEAGTLGARRDCQLAAGHLSEGVLAVSNGSAYYNSRFAAAVEGCK